MESRVTTTSKVKKYCFQTKGGRRLREEESKLRSDCRRSSGQSEDDSKGNSEKVTEEGGGSGFPSWFRRRVKVHFLRQG